MQFHRLVLASAVISLFYVGCSSDDPVMVVDTGVGDDAAVDGGTPPEDTGVVDTGLPPPPDTGVPDTGVPDTGVPDTGAPDTGNPDTGMPPPGVINVSGQLRKLGEYLNNVNTGAAEASLLAYGVAPLQTTLTQAAPNAGNYALQLPPNGQVILYANKLGYFPTYNTVTTEAVDIQGKNIYIAENAWLNEIAMAHNVDLATTFACHAPNNTTDQCVYAAVVGKILDDGAAGNGTRRPVAGILKTEITVAAGPTLDETWYKKGPYFLDYTGTSSAAAQASVVFNDGAGNYRGGYFITWVEVPQVVGPESISVRISINHMDVATMTNRYFGPIDVKVFRPYGVTYNNIYETGQPPMPPPPTNIDFDSQIYPLFLPVNQGGYGCQGCHTNANGATPTGGMNLYGGPDVAYASLNPANYPQRVNLGNPSDSLLLKKPLYEATGVQDHPIFAFVSEDDPGYKLIYQWIQEGAVRTVVLAPVSFQNEIRPLLYNQVANGGIGCRNCHYDGVDALTAPGGFYMGGGVPGLYDELTNEAPQDNGATGELFRVNKTQGQTDRSLVLINPLFGNPEPHPVKIFNSNADPRYQLIYRWIAEGYQNN